MKRPAGLLPLLLFAQFAGTSPWFAGNAIVDDLVRDWALAPSAVADVTAAVNLGFIAGTLVFALLTISDRYSPRLVFFVCAVLCAGSNFMLLFMPSGLAALLICRFATGFFLAGLYPVGMKIAASWYRDDLGRVLGFLIGALVLGTAFPHLIRGLGGDLPWADVIVAISLFALCGGFAVLFGVGDGPLVSRSQGLDLRAAGLVFTSKRFRASACGYFGHMWELYSLWTFAPLLLAVYTQTHSLSLDLSIATFCFIAAGAVGCGLGGLVSLKRGSAVVATSQLAVSGLCCLFAPFVMMLSAPFFIVFMLIWGITVAGDSPQFSTLNASSAPRELVGSALTIVNCLGFSLTVISIQLCSWLLPLVTVDYLPWLLLPGPLLGIWAMRPLLQRQQQQS